MHIPTGRKIVRTLILRSMVWLFLFWLVLELLACVVLWGKVQKIEELPNDAIMPFHSQTLWYFKPNSSFEGDGIEYRIDENSMRTSNSNEENEAILFLGDSSTFGIVSMGLWNTSTCSEWSPRSHPSRKTQQKRCGIT